MVSKKCRKISHVSCEENNIVTFVATFCLQVESYHCTHDALPLCKLSSKPIIACFIEFCYTACHTSRRINLNC